MAKVDWNDVESDEDIIMRLRKVIKQKGIEQNKLADMANMPYKQFNALISGRKTLRGEHIVVLCKLLKIEPNDLLNYYGEEGEKRKERQS